jgi:hypothetical protein
MKFRGGEFLTGTTGNFQPELTHPSLDKSAPSKKVAAKVFILQGGAEPFSSAPVWAEPSQLLIGMWLFDQHWPPATFR